MKRTDPIKQKLRLDICSGCVSFNKDFEVGVRINKLWFGMKLKGYPQCNDCGCFLKTTPLGKLGKTTIDAEECPKNIW